MHPLTQIAREITDKYCKSSLKVGAIVKHPDGRTVKIASGYYRDPTYGRISNFWYWNEVREDGTLGPQESGYGW